MSQQNSRLLIGGTFAAEVTEAVDRLEFEYPEAVEIVDTLRNIIRDHTKDYRGNR